MIGDADSLKAELRAAGLSRAAIEAAWPQWWSDKAEASLSARTELRLSVARNLGLAPKALVGERVDFVWRDRARFKHLRVKEDISFAALNSFGMSVGRSLIQATDWNGDLIGISASDLRCLLLQMGPPDLRGIISLCWALGVPIANLKIWPLIQKSMHAMVIGHHNRHAILCSREVSYSALAAFTLAHEIGHIALGHVNTGDILIDAEYPAKGIEDDEEEIAADRYALEVLIGEHDPDFKINFNRFNHFELADAVIRAGPSYGIDPGTLALVIAHKYNTWPVAMAAMRIIQPKSYPVSDMINQVAAGQLNLERLGSDNAVFIKRAIGLDDV